MNNMPGSGAGNGNYPAGVSDADFYDDEPDEPCEPMDSFDRQIFEEEKENGNVHDEVSVDE